MLGQKCIFKFLLLFIFLSITFSTTLVAQNNIYKQKDSLYLSHPFKDRINAFKSNFAKKLKPLMGNDFSIFGSMSLSRQLINDGGVTVPVNYIYENVNNINFKPGYIGGFRWDGIYHDQHRYAVILAVNHANVGNHYTNKYNLNPLLNEYTHFKADDQYTTLSLALHYKKLLPINDMKKYKFYAVFGPSFDYKISNISDDNLIDKTGKRAFINGDLGAEFDNKGYYILFAHYKLGSYISHSAASVQLNRFEIGMSIKAKDLF